MDAQAPAARRQVFLKYRELFTGKNVRKRKAIRKILLKNLPELEASAGDAHINNIISILKSLLEDGVFQSEEIASKHFPDLIIGPPSEIAAGNISKKRKASPTRSINVKRMVQIEAIDKSSPEVTAGISTTNSSGNRPSYVTPRPSAFPYNVQHYILSLSQQILEEACFRFVKRWLPSLLEKCGWVCAAAVELTKWVRVIKKHLDILPSGCMNTEQQKRFKETLPCINRLRHTAVHRLHLTSVQLLKQVHSAHILAEVLQDSECRNKLQTIHFRMDMCVKNMDHDMEAMEQEAERRARQLEQMLRTTFAQQQKKLSSAAGQGLIDSITTEFGLPRPNAAAEIKATFTWDEHTGNTGGTILIDEDDIESDENRLQTEL
ncbi:hypothetical protein COCC4DRAFT_143796 [Bipolaris maydis ATCC 48331]|uniref:Ubiquinol-cytochrome-c reductase cytochrome c1 n=2 Tax=Cochliobolus heterostrophus TaxID=5016 RepID=M2UF63_COCH5|nr:uncharacterized protein COCC4DRAFT_143796 [Bipolaris maydis ATCC 48331]EMD86638.1 hypothetical protein COCHEDRAFT_1228132 [Bipolaris maydis C5]KAJ5052621.1 hypothetical protein J3E74DRAFT_478870 [Bipolaris maydis]ENI03034.1 hypothetical protein COCC4DRAFT_143796 [Bipolaris maydis ATCC 48331]KAJ6192293.1 hypothetical protein J3E72DRAFT_389784 [Bipolaris maydis]KAJ6203770.1 hypothetical protein PSV09DRAFT_1228132 [Bipolaris maydis]